MKAVRRWTKIKVFILLILAVSLVACLPMGNSTLPQTDEKATYRSSESTSTPTVQVAIRTLLPVDTLRNAPTVQMTASTPTPFRSQLRMKVRNGGLTAELQEIDLDPEYPTVTLCTDLPTEADWLPRFSTIYQGREIQVTGWMLVDPVSNAVHARNRCYQATLSTEIFDLGVPSGELVFSLDYFELSIPENLPQTNLQKVFGPWRFTINLHEQ